MRTPKRRTGDLGEDLACRFLVKHGYEIIEKNYLKPWGEIDIVAFSENNEKIHFIEVKTVSCEIAGDTVSRETIRPEENMHFYKIKRFSRAIETYMHERKISHETPFQVDLLTVRIDFKRRIGRVGVLENIF